MHVKVGHEFIFKFSKNAHKLHNLHLIGCGGGFYEDINALTFYFNSFQELTIDEVRLLMVENIELLMQWINSDPKLSLYLNELPFSINKVTLMIAFHTPLNHNEYFDKPAVALVYLQNGFLYYDYYNKNKRNFEILHSESYKKAFNLVQHQKNLESLPDNVPEYTVEELNCIFKNHPYE